MDSSENAKKIAINRNAKKESVVGLGAVAGKSGSVEMPDAEKPKKIISMLNGIITFSLVAIAFGVPVFFTGLTFQGLQFEKQLYFYVWILVALVAWATQGIIRGELKIRRTPLDFPILAVLATYILSAIFSVDRWHSFWGFFGDPSRGLMSILAIIVLYYLILSNFSGKRLFLMAGGLIASNIIVALWTVPAIFGLKFLPTAVMGIAPLSLIGTVSGLATYFAMMLPLLIMAVLLLTQKNETRVALRKTALTVCLTMAVINLFLIFTFYSFAPWLAIVVGISLFLIFVISRVVELKEGWMWVPMATFASVVLMLLVGSSFGSVKIARINLPVEVSPNYQFSWDIAKESLKNDFFLGSGPATYGYDFSRYKPQSFNLNSFYDLRFYQGTGLFFESISTVGALASIALVILLLSFVGIGFYMLSRDKERNKIYQLGLFVSAIIFLISAFSVKIDGAILIIGSFISILSLGALLSHGASEEAWLSLSLKASPKFALALAFVFTLVSAGVIFIFMFLGKAYVADVYAGKAVKAEKVTQEGSIVDFTKAINLFDKEGRYYTNMSQQYMVVANNEFLKKESERNVELLQQYLVNANDLAKQGEILMGSDVFTIESVASVYENTVFFIPSAAQTAEEKYQKALSLDPHNPAYLLKLGQLKMAQIADKKDEEKNQLLGQAKDLFQQSLDEKENFAAGHYSLGLALAALGKSDEAIDAMGRAVQLESNNITYLFNLGQLYQKRGNGDDLKFAEALYKEVFKYNADETNTHISLGILYEKEGKNDQAIEEYNKVLSLIPQDSTELIAKVQKLISNIKAGKQNTFENLNQEQAAGQDASSVDGVAEESVAPEENK